MKAIGHCGGVIVGLFCAYAPLAAAQSTPAEWSSTEKIINGNCGDGAIAHVVERAGSMNIKIFIDGKRAADFNVPLASDGSGKAEFEGATGPNIMEVSAGAGKRPMKNARMDGLCQWSWSPK
jgi:hypothetical protein